MAPALVAPTVTAVGAGHGSLSEAAKPIKETVNTDDTIFGVPKWALAAAAGGVVALGLAYYVLSAPDDNSTKKSKRKKDKSSKKRSEDSKSNSTTTTPEKAKDKTPKKEENKVSIEDVGEDDEEMVCSKLY